MKLEVAQFTFNPFQENTYIISAENGDAVIIDPGCSNQEEEQELRSFIEEKQLNLLALLNTHAHIDHVLGNAFILENYNIPFYLHPLAIKTLEAVPNYAHVYGFPNYKVSPLPNYDLKDRETIQLGTIELKVFFTPGHAPGHVVFYHEKQGFVINGDVLFNGSFGRVDLPGGDLETLKTSILQVMFNLPEETVVYCGHGPETTIGKEKVSNYILNF